MKNIAIVLTGCGHLDGAEITESVSLLIAFSKLGAQIQCFAPDLEISPIHSVRESAPRRALEEAARITRGKVSELQELNALKFDAVVFAGGRGVVTLLSDWAERGAKCQLLPAAERIILDFYQANKPIGAVCIAPVLIAKTLGKHKVTLTIGDDDNLIREVLATGAQHEVCPVGEFISDRDTKVVTTPAYMYEAKPHEVFAGISGLASEIYEMA